MLTPLASYDQLNLLRAPSGRSVLDLGIRTVRPSVLDLRFSGDAWIVDRGNGCFAMCLGNYPLAWIEGLALDLPSLNRMFHALRHRRPRQRRSAVPRWTDMTDSLPPH
jgi:hypothetical protein